MSNLIELDVRKAFFASQGSVTIAAETLGARRADLTKYVAERPHLQEFVFNLREEVTDDCQAVLGDAVDVGAPWAVKYTLKTIGASRGYVEGAVQPQVGQIAQPAIAANLSTPDISDNAAQKEKDAQLLASLPEEAVTIALEHARGHVAQAANTLGVPRAYVRKVIDLCPDLQVVLFQEREKLVDRAEDVLREAVRARRPWAVMFVLNTRGRNRGFGPPIKPSRRARLMANAFPAPLGPNPDELAASGASLSEPMNQLQARSEQEQLNVPQAARLSAGRENQAANLLQAPVAPSNDLSEVLNRIGAELASKQPIAAGPEPVARNAPCPCNSGMKFKRCCGR